MNFTFMYIDPAVMAYVVQIGAGIVIACGTLFGIFRKRIVAFFKTKKYARMERKLERQQKKAEAAQAAKAESTQETQE